MDLTPVIEGVLAKWSEIICSRIRNRWDTKAPQWEHSTYWFFLGATKGAIISRIVGDGIGAFLLEYGSGSKLDTSNPYLQDYMSSDHWNKARSSKGNAFLGRAAGEIVYTPDGGSYESEGGAKGLNLEQQLKSKTKDFPPYIPQEAMHIMREEVQEALHEIAEDLSTGISKAIADEVYLMLTARIYL